MNTQHFIYALEVAKTGSITLAADNLYMSQPTLSKAIKDLESSLDFSVFKRTSKGVVPTQKGAEFLVHARKIITQIERMEQALYAKDATHQLFSLAIPRAGYIAHAASEFFSTFDKTKNMELDILETSSMKVIDAVAGGHYILGIIRYHVEDEDYFLKSLAEKGLHYEAIWETDFVALMRRDHPLVRQQTIHVDDLSQYVEIAYGDDEVPYIRVSETETADTAEKDRKRILVYDRGTQFNLLLTNPLSYAMVSPMPKEVLDRNDFVQRKCKGVGQFKDLIITRNTYRFSKLDRAFINKLYYLRNELAYGE